MKYETQKRTLAGKAFSVVLALVLAVGLMPPIHAFGEETSGGQPSEQLAAGQDAPVVEEAGEPQGPDREEAGEPASGEAPTATEGEPAASEGAGEP